MSRAKPGQEPPTDAQAEAELPVGSDEAGASGKTTVAADTAEETTLAPAVVKDPVETSVVENVAPKVEHETVVKDHEEKEKTVIDKERHQDHYHTTVVPAQAEEVLPEEHRYEDTATEVKEFQHDDGAAKNQSVARNTGFQDTKDEMKTEQKTVEATEVGSEKVHHHLHETIQPVIEKSLLSPVSLDFRACVLISPCRNDSANHYAQDHPRQGGAPGCCGG